MFSKEESARLRENFWTDFGKTFPTKWTLYNTKIKHFSFKFYFDTKKACVLLDIEGNSEHRQKYFEKMQSLKGILETDFLPEVAFHQHFLLENGKEISRISVEKTNVCIHNKATWQETMEFLNEKMTLFEAFWEEYKDILQEENNF